MTSTQIHLALTHVPVVLSYCGLIILVVALIKKNETLTRTSLYFLLFAGLFTLPVYFSGEGAEEAIEHLPGISENAIESHEDIAKTGLIVVLLNAVLASSGLVFFHRKSLLKYILPIVLIVTLAACGIFFKTAHLGGLIRHPELKEGFKGSQD